MSFQVHVGDDLPQKICTTCAENLDLIYNFKIKAIACDMELSRNVYKDINFTYTQVSDDPLNVSVIEQYKNLLIHFLLLFR